MVLCKSIDYPLILLMGKTPDVVALCFCTHMFISKSMKTKIWGEEIGGWHNPVVSYLI